MTERVEIAETVLVEYHRLKKEPPDCPEESIIDMVTDLLHLAYKENLDASAILQMAQINFQAESAGHKNENDKLMVAKTILSQMGGTKWLSSMIGARNYAGGDNYVTFQFRGSNKANLVRITLMPSDTYKVEFFKTRGTECKKVSEDDMIFCDNLKTVFEMTTGLII